MLPVCKSELQQARPLGGGVIASLDEVFTVVQFNSGEHLPRAKQYG